MVCIVGAAPAGQTYSAWLRRSFTGQNDGGSSFTGAESVAVPIERPAALWIERFQGAESSHHKRGQMIHASNDCSINFVLPDHAGSLLQRDQAGNAGSRDATDRAGDAVCGGEISGQQVALKMAAGALGARTSGNDAF